jgi:hypothetical protein
MGVLASAELYDPATGTWAATGSLGTARGSHTATLLLSGQVLVAGGNANTPQGFASAELYDPATGTWAATGSLAEARYAFHTMTLLPSGQVLVVGGGGGSDSIPHALQSAELYDPATGTWAWTGPLPRTRSLHSATLLLTGKVLVAGGFSDGGVHGVSELYDPATGTWAETGRLITARTFHTATLLPSGKVLVAAGNPGQTPPLASAELYDPATGTWSTTGDLVNARYKHTATLLSSGQVLIVGGWFVPTSAELYE